MSQSTEDNDQDIPALLFPVPENLADEPLRQIIHLNTLYERHLSDHLNLIDILPPITETYISGLERAGTDTLCAICYTNLLDTAESSSSVVVQLPCAHLYHGACLATWFNNQITCPTCRFDPDFHVIIEDLFAGFEPHLYQWLKTVINSRVIPDIEALIEAIRGPRNPGVQSTFYREESIWRIDVRDGHLGAAASGDPEQEVD